MLTHLRIGEDSCKIKMEQFEENEISVKNVMYVLLKDNVRAESLSDLRKQSKLLKECTAEKI